jgi:DNA-directed RNA polymerase subunit RPC12/RpoP
MLEEETLDIPIPTPTYENHCWNCGAEINDVICQDAGLDSETGEPNGYECNDCGKDLGDYRRRHCSK